MTQAARKKRPLTLEYLIQTRSKRSGTRIHSTGRTERLRDDGAWERLTRLTPAALAELTTAVDASGYFDLPATIAADDGPSGTDLHWTIDLDGRAHEVRAQLGSHMHPALQILNDLVQRLVAEALDAAAGE